MNAGGGSGAGERSQRRGPIRRLYHWVLDWAHRPGGPAALFGIATVESFIFPIPPDVLLIPLALGNPRRALRFAGLCTLGSIIGAVFGYLIGLGLYEGVGRPIIELYGYADEYARIGEAYRRNLVLALGTAGFTPIPFKVFTIAAGGFQVPFIAFLAVTAVSRGMRFFLVAVLIRLYGERIRDFIERYFNLLTLAFAVLLIGGFLILGVLSAR
ncbi:MAG: DedA family protein [Gemmatimonadota bacterium]|nr:MAG: DedA family protein [Gemmatimonadota bacterium]